MKRPIYLDYHSSTPVDLRVLEAMLPCFREKFGNPSSQSHAAGWEADKLVEKARSQFASLIGCYPKEVVFTAGASEANNLAIKGAAEIYRQKGTHLMTQATEHKSVLQPCRYLQKKGYQLTVLPVDETGLVRLDDLKAAVTDETLLISVMAANNEIGTLQPLREIGAFAKAKGVLFHVDAAQALGKIPIDVQKDGIDLLSCSAHKMYGPKGIGALYVRKHAPRVRLEPLVHGGGQEEGLRSGTLNVPGIVGLGAACEIAKKEMPEEAKRVGALRDRLFEGLKSQLDEVYLNGHLKKRLWNNLNVSFLYTDGEALLTALGKDMAVSTGSACISSRQEASYVLKALGLNAERIQSSLRFGLGRFTTQEEIEETIRKVVKTVKKIRAVSPVYQSFAGRKAQ